MGEFDPRNPCPERYRDYLYLLARLRIGGRPVGIISPSDIVQVTVLKAHKCRAQFQGRNEAQYRAYLRKILANTVADVFRGGANEAQIRHTLDTSSARVESWLVASGRSPSEEAQHAEVLLRLAEGLSRLRPCERTAVEMRYFEEPPCSLDAIARKLNRPTVRAVASLLGRALEKLRDHLHPETAR